MKNFERLFEMYVAGNKSIYDEVKVADFKDLYHECDKNLSKYYEFKCWLESIEEYV